MIEARQVCRNRITTSTTSRVASNSVETTDLIESRTNTVVSYTEVISTPGGSVLRTSSILATTASRICSAFAPGAWKMPMAAAFWPLRRARNV